jgi:DNA-binding transcriptional regulator YdaS (Cro superfamily)
MCQNAAVTRLLSRLRGRERLLNANGNGSTSLRIPASRAQPIARAAYVVTAAELAPCTCPEYCERDHENE